MTTVTDFPSIDSGYQYFGYLNSISEVRNTELNDLLTACREMGHERESYNTNRGDHGIWCDTCLISYKYCSGD